MLCAVLPLPQMTDSCSLEFPQKFREGVAVILFTWGSFLPYSHGQDLPILAQVCPEALLLCPRSLRLQDKPHNSLLNLNFRGITNTF